MIMHKKTTQMNKLSPYIFDLNLDKSSNGIPSESASKDSESSCGTTKDSLDFARTSFDDRLRAEAEMNAKCNIAKFEDGDSRLANFKLHTISGVNTKTTLKFFKCN